MPRGEDEGQGGGNSKAPPSGTILTPQRRIFYQQLSVSGLRSSLQQPTTWVRQSLCSPAVIPHTASLPIPPHPGPTSCPSLKVSPVTSFRNRSSSCPREPNRSTYTRASVPAWGGGRGVGVGDGGRAGALRRRPPIRVEVRGRAIPPPWV